MDRVEKYLAYLESLKSSKNELLMENVITGFKALVEYHVNGDISMRSTDVMTEDVEDESEGMEEIPKPSSEELVVDRYDREKNEPIGEGEFTSEWTTVQLLDEFAQDADMIAQILTWMDIVSEQGDNVMFIDHLDTSNSESVDEFIETMKTELGAKLVNDASKEFVNQKLEGSIREILERSSKPVSEDQPLDESLEMLAESLLEGKKSMTKEEIMDRIRHSKWLKDQGHSGLGGQGTSAMNAAKMAMGMINELQKSRGQEPTTDNKEIALESIFEGVEVESFENFVECNSKESLVESIDIPLSDEQLTKIQAAVQAYKTQQDKMIQDQKLGADDNMVKSYLNKIGQDLWLKALSKMGIENPSPEMAKAAAKKAMLVA
jgi:hypothetical protein